MKLEDIVNTQKIDNDCLIRAFSVPKRAYVPPSQIVFHDVSISEFPEYFTVLDPMVYQSRQSSRLRREDKQLVRTERLASLVLSDLSETHISNF